MITLEQTAQFQDTPTVRFQIKSLDDPTFGITLTVGEDEDPETLALEHLGYFVVPESVTE